jgi:antitoxin HicB
MMEFQALLQKKEGAYLVSFPDFPSINTYGTSLDKALINAREALNGALESDFERGYRLPEPLDFTGKRGYHPIRLLPHIEIAYELKKLRNGHSQSEIARRLGITYQAYQKLENPRKCNPTVKTLEKIGAVLGKDLVVSFRD